MKLNLAISSCPNDTFIFDALVNGRIHNQGICFDLQLLDIQHLNTLAIQNEVDIVKISYALYPIISRNYQMLTAGSALGFGVGPLLVSKRKIFSDEVKYATIAIPGEQTTANMLLSLAYPDAKQKILYLFSEIESAVADNEVDVGLLIHEGRFTFKKKGLRLISDLGEYWEKESGYPIPLGGIAVKRTLPEKVKQNVNLLIRNSLEYAFKNPTHSMPFVKRYAKEMDEDVINQHINLYVNDYSLDLGEKGQKAVVELFNRAIAIGFFEKVELTHPFFVE